LDFFNALDSFFNGFPFEELYLRSREIKDWSVNLITAWINQTNGNASCKFDDYLEIVCQYLKGNNPFDTKILTYAKAFIKLQVIDNAALFVKSMKRNLNDCKGDEKCNFLELIKCMI
jgi:hypothetical protein